MAIISYKIKNDRVTLTNPNVPHPMDTNYRQANQAWAALRKHYKMTTDELRKAGWRVKMDIDETELAIEAAEVAVDHAPMPGIVRRILGGLFGRKG